MQFNFIAAKKKNHVELPLSDNNSGVCWAGAFYAGKINEIDQNCMAFTREIRRTTKKKKYSKTNKFWLKSYSTNIFLLHFFPFIHIIQFEIQIT